MKNKPKSSSNIRILALSGVVWSVLGVVGSLMAEIYPIENLSPQSTLGGQGGGQTFSPSGAAGYSGETSLYLTSFTMWRGGSNNGATQTSTETYLVIYDGNPDVATQVGASSSFVDTENTAAGARYDWVFDHLELDPDTQYWAVLSNNPVDDNVLQNNGGTWLQMSLQTSADNYAGTDEWAIIANRDPHNNAAKPDLRFEARFDTAPTAGLEVVSGNAVFGELFHGEAGSFSNRSIVIRNAEDGIPLTLDGVGLAAGTSSVFSISSAPAGGSIIQPGEEFTIVVKATGGGGGVMLKSELALDVQEAGYDRRFPVSATIRTTGDAYPLLRNGDFESELDDWTGSGELVPGGAGGNAVRLRGVGDNRANPAGNFEELLGQDFGYSGSGDFTVRFTLVIPDFQEFTGLTPDGGFLDRSFQFVVMGNAPVKGDDVFGDDDAAKAMVNLTYMAAGVPGDAGEGFFLFDGQTGAFERVGGLGTLDGSTGFSESGELPGVRYPYQLTFVAHGFGAPGASYDITISDPDTGTSIAEAIGLTTWHGLSLDDSRARSILFTTHDASADGGGEFAPLQPSFWVDEVSAVLADTLPLPLLAVEQTPGIEKMQDHSRENVGFVVRNVGLGADLQLISGSSSHPALSLSSSSTLPRTLAPGEALELEVEIDALDFDGDGVIDDSVELTTNDPIHEVSSLPVLAQILAEGRRLLVDFDDGDPLNGVHDGSLRNGGFEESFSGDRYLDATPWYSRYTPEGDSETLVFDDMPATGSLHARAGGEQGSGTRVQPAQAFSFEEWILAEGDRFQVDVTWKSDVPLDGSNGLGVRIVAIDASGNTIASPSGKGFGNSPRLISAYADLEAPGVYQTNTFVTDPVPAGDPWIGGRVFLWLLNGGSRDEFVEIDNVRMIGLLPQPSLHLADWSIAPASGLVSLRWPDIGRRYRIEGASDLGFGEPDFSIDVNESNGMSIDGPEVVFEFSDPSGGPRRFWRVATY